MSAGHRIVRVEALASSVVKALRSEILTGKLVGGDRLKEEAIGARFGLSRVPVREALRQLESEGFVVSEKYKGVRVAARSFAVVVELMQVRRGLEVVAAQLAAEQHGGTVARELRATVEQASSTASTDPEDGLPMLTRRFHQLVVEASGNHQLQVRLRSLVDQVAWAFEQKSTHLRREEFWNDHRAIAIAITSGSVMQAGLLMDEHLQKDEQFYLASMR